MGRSTQLKTPFPEVGVDLIVAPFGPVKVSKETVTLVAEADAASSTRLKLTTSFRAPERRTVLPSHARLITFPVVFSVWLVARNSSRETLSPPSLAQTPDIFAPKTLEALKKSTRNNTQISRLLTVPKLLISCGPLTF